MYFGWCNASQVWLKASTIEGAPLQLASVGVPFILQVHIEGGANDTKPPEIKGLENHVYQFEGTTSTIHTVRGFMTVDRVFQYRVRVDQEGVFVIGPAKVKVQGGTEDSNTLTLRVTAASVQDAKAKQQSSCILSVSQDEVYVGQKIILSIKINISEDVQLMQLTPPELKEFSVGPIEGPIVSTINEDSDTKKCHEWRYTIFPKKTGKLVIPALTALINIPKKSSHLDFFGSFFGGSHEQKTLLSNAITVHAKPLPPYHQNVSFVGSIVEFSMIVDKYKLAMNEAVLATLGVQGDGDIIHLDLQKLELPQEVRSYPSKERVEPSMHGFSKKQEFVLQAINEGNITIPAQELTYFDLEREEYKTIKTKPISLLVMPSQQPTTIENVAVPSNSDEINSVWNQGQWYAAPEIMLPRSWMILIFILPILLIGCLQGFALLRRQRYYKNRLALRRAIRQLQEIKNTQKYEKLYELFLCLFATCFALQKQVIDTEFLISKMNELGFSAQELKEWHQFLMHCMQCSFDQQEISIPKDILLERARVWLTALEKKL